MSALARFQSRTDTVGHSSVQPWSAGAIFPATITRVERYLSPLGEHQVDAMSDGYQRYLDRFYTGPLADRLDFTSWELTLDGRSEEFATYDDAHACAQELISDLEQRANWREGDEEMGLLHVFEPGRA